MKSFRMIENFFIALASQESRHEKKNTAKHTVNCVAENWLLALQRELNSELLIDKLIIPKRAHNTWYFHFRLYSKIEFLLRFVSAMKS